jgi:glycosyltransferase involved in cell wall biosynthesis
VPVDVVQSYADSVEYVGELPDVRPLLAEADCLVLPSYREGMPRTVLEAASMGRIALVSDVEGCRDAIEPGVTGLAFAVRSASAVAASMRDIADREAGEVHAMSSAARRMAEERFSERLCIEPYRQILRQVVSGQAVAGC